MTNSEIFTTAHVEARGIQKRWGGSYAEAFAEGLKAVYASIRAAKNPVVIPYSTVRFQPRQWA